ncbi:uncharacterized protein LOC125026891 [Penaeus chinensis]|uniref:uncharacterized protein LOC125026891 n=1 Tax=Penaeus chinensis TaxID=139456 RepID=UPI001FB7FD03|nr:uncharacterized protein LOC125026891 [Penaeus chinensis]
MNISLQPKLAQIYSNCDIIKPKKRQSKLYNRQDTVAGSFLVLRSHLPTARLGTKAIQRHHRRCVSSSLSWLWESSWESSWRFPDADLTRVATAGVGDPRIMLITGANPRRCPSAPLHSLAASNF